jgi:hypothetical protein
VNQYDEKFFEYMRNRMKVSFYKYGDIRDAYPHKVDALANMWERVKKYKETGNTEWLVDAANFLMIEFMLPSIPGAEFRATDSNESPGRRVDGEMTAKDNAEI